MEGILAAVDEADGDNAYAPEQDDEQRLGTIGEEQDAMKEQNSAQGTAKNKQKEEQEYGEGFEEDSGNDEF